VDWKATGKYVVGTLSKAEVGKAGVYDGMRNNIILENLLISIILAV
jgi:hypothetical protein